MLEENNEFNIDTKESQQEYVYEEQYNSYSELIEQNKKKQDIRRLGVIIGIPAICLSVIGYVWSFAYLFFTTKVAGLTTSEAIKLSQDPAVQQILQIILSCFMFLLPFSIAAKCCGIRLDQTILLGKAKKGTFLPFLLFGVGFCSFSNIAMSYADNIFRNFGIDYEVDFGDNPKGLFGFLLSFIATAIVPALVEEFACRGIILGLLKKYGEGFAIITSSIIFGVMHGNFEQIPFAVLVGLILGYIYVKTGSIWPCIAVHGINNAISVFFSYLENTMPIEIQNILYIVYVIITMLAAVVGVLMFSKNTNEKYNLERFEETTTEKNKYTWFFTSWVIIAFIILNFVESLGYFKI